MENRSLFSLLRPYSGFRPRFDELDTRESPASRTCFPERSSSRFRLIVEGNEILRPDGRRGFLRHDLHGGEKEHDKHRLPRNALNPGVMHVSFCKSGTQSVSESLEIIFPGQHPCQIFLPFSRTRNSTKAQRNAQGCCTWAAISGGMYEPFPDNPPGPPRTAPPPRWERKRLIPAREVVFNRKKNLIRESAGSRPVGNDPQPPESPWPPAPRDQATPRKREKSPRRPAASRPGCPHGIAVDRDPRSVRTEGRSPSSAWATPALNASAVPCRPGDDRPSALRCAKRAQRTRLRPPPREPPDRRSESGRSKSVRAIEDEPHGIGRDCRGQGVCNEQEPCDAEAGA